MRLIVWRREALADLERHNAWLSTLEHALPDRTIRRIRAAVETLARLGDIGRPIKAPGIRELSVRNAPYVIANRITEDAIDILAVYHTSQMR